MASSHLGWSRRNPPDSDPSREPTSSNVCSTAPRAACGRARADTTPGHHSSLPRIAYRSSVEVRFHRDSRMIRPELTNWYRFGSAAALCADKPASWAMTGRIRSASAAASLALRSDPAVQPPSFAPRRRGEACLGPLRNERSLAPARRRGGGRRGQRRRQAP